ncbi:hypothetical protein EIN_080970 [Entamoeba invadens IP1]|uniref:hypothetical protein n=1 Tax=Entamoeba invadens IP1 TaxID=370355 RepID=UPI0002C3D3A3|nr:hypothetical protein EIN_080970 [Entamoeba invadens IP1]ELP85125.1 hypothetical protein EIN_080970 [Entamoeba invadens IP1]|eukprot:XP_004184471.1 hypothetical protein EIN_080970 [Entamoeba invadens IP1]
MQEINTDATSRIINHGPVIIITAYDEENKRSTGMACQWNMPLSRFTAMVKFGPLSHTLQCVLKTNKFVINVPLKRSMADVITFGSKHGNEVDKFPLTNFHLLPCVSKEFEHPLRIEEAACCIEMTVERVTPFEDGSKLIVGKTVACSADPTFFKDSIYTCDKDTPDELLTLHHYGGNKFGVTRPL